MIQLYQVIKTIPLTTLTKGLIIGIDEKDNTVFHHEKSPFRLNNDIIKTYCKKIKQNSFEVGDIIQNKKDKCLYIIKGIKNDFKSILDSTIGLYEINAYNSHGKNKLIRLNETNDYIKVNMYYFVSVRDNKISIQKEICDKNPITENMRKAMKNYFLTKENAEKQLAVWKSQFE